MQVPPVCRYLIFKIVVPDNNAALSFSITPSAEKEGAKGMNIPSKRIDGILVPLTHFHEM